MTMQRNVARLVIGCQDGGRLDGEALQVADEKWWKLSPCEKAMPDKEIGR